MNAEFSALEKLAHAGLRLPTAPARLPTLLEILEYSENACTRLLAFFIDTTQPHQLHDLLVRALLATVGKEPPSNTPITTLEVRREARTPKDNRLDLLIRTDRYIIGVEHKIGAPLYNDLTDYATLLSNEAAKHPSVEVMALVLSVWPVATHALKGGFQNVTHHQLREQVQRLWGTYALTAHPSYQLYLTDLLSTLHRLTTRPPMDQQTVDFLSRNETGLRHILALVRQADDDIRHRLEKVRTDISAPADFKQWI
ncbi:MAG: PD-(D/E)XK nuclease family protein [Hymenobacteraceae bacterium]|nr:PD-(D/E)XK nuclease family protein [Hymenobacteraceae bacterium]